MPTVTSKLYINYMTRVVDDIYDSSKRYIHEQFLHQSTVVSKHNSHKQHITYLILIIKTRLMINIT